MVECGAGSQMLRSFLLVIAVLGILIGLAFLSYFKLPDVGRAKELGGIFQASVTVVAIVAGGIFAYHKLQIFRDFEPHLTTSHTISHRFIGDSYVHIAVTADLYNSSRVKMEFREGLFRLQQIAPVSDEETEKLYAQVFVERDYNHLQWATLDEATLQWGPNELTVEPGESHPETYEFIVSTNVESVMVYTYFNNPTFPTFSKAPGWGRATVHDIFHDREPNGVNEG